MSAHDARATRRLRDAARRARVRRVREPAAADGDRARRTRHAPTRHWPPSSPTARSAARAPTTRSSRSPPTAPSQDIDPAVLDALRLGVHQLLSTRVASHAAVNESVELARGAGGRGAAGFANAVLRRVARDTPGDWMTRVAESRPLRRRAPRPALLAPGMGRARLPARAGRRGTRRRARGAAHRRQRVAARHDGGACPTSPTCPTDARRTPYSPIGFRLGGGDPDSLVRGSGGRIRVQDEGSQLAALALTRATPVAPGERWLDLCAGPGRQDRRARRRGARARRVARGERDLAGARRARAPGARRRAARRAGVRAGRPASARRMPPRPTTASSSTRPAPGLGALRRRPEARWRKSPARRPGAHRSCRASCSPRRSARSSPAASSPTSPARRTSPRPRASSPTSAASGAGRSRSSTRARRHHVAVGCRPRTCRRRPTASGARSCGRTGTTPTRCRSPLLRRV